MVNFNVFFNVLLPFESALKEAIQAYNKESFTQQMLLEEKDRLLAKEKALLQELSLYDKTRQFLQHISEYARITAKERLEQIVTDSLQFVFGSQFSFRIKITGTKVRPEAEFLVATHYGQLDVENTPQDSRGGGIVDVVSVALRIALLEVHYPKIVGPIILDEPFKHVSSEYMPAAGQLLKNMGTLFDRQLIIVTHNLDLKEIADRLFEVKIIEGVSHVNEV